MVVLAKEKVVQDLETSREEEKRRPGIYLKTSEWDGDTLILNVYKFCSCGHHDKARTHQFIDQSYLRIDSEQETPLVCPACGNDQFCRPGDERLTYVIFEETDTHVKLRLGGYEYNLSRPHLLHAADEDFEQKWKEMKPVAYSIRYKVIINKKTRMIYLFNAQRKTLRTISRWGNIGAAESFLHAAMSDDRFRPELKKWYEFFYRHIPEYAMKEWKIDPKETRMTRIPLDKLFLLYSYPYHIHFGGCTLFEPRNQKERDLARKAEGKLDLYRIKLPNATKKIVKEMERRPSSYGYLEVLSMMENKNLLLNAITSLKKPEDNDFMSMLSLASQNTLGAFQYPLHFKKRFIRQLFGSQEVFDQKLGRGDSESLRLMQDSMRMFRNLENQMKHFEADESKAFWEKNIELIRGKKLKTVHDGLMKAQRFCVEKDKKIPQARMEKGRFNRTYGELEFRIAERTHELIDVGSDMSICVGSYGHLAVAGKVSIVTVYGKENKPLLCIEIKKEAIVQVKKKYNQRLSHSSPEDKELIEAFKTWIEEAGLALDTHDFSLNPGEDKPALAQAVRRDDDLPIELLHPNDPFNEFDNLPF